MQRNFPSSPFGSPDAPTAPGWAVLKALSLLALCAAYIQGGWVKALDFQGAVAEMTHFGLQPAPLFAAGVIVMELGCSAMVITGRGRWIGALILAVFTVLASFMANRFWSVSTDQRFTAMNAFFEHIGLAGAFCYVAWVDLRARLAPPSPNL